jgi:hypothetical protein
MRSSISSSEKPVTDKSASERLTAADRPGVAQPVPERPIPPRPWRNMFVVALTLTLLLTGLWEWHMRKLGLEPGDLGDGASAWAEQRRRIDTEDVAVAIVGDSRILFDTDLDRFAVLTGVRPVQLALPGTNARPFLEDLAADPNFKGLVIVGIADLSYFRKEAGLMGDALKLYRYESPAQHTSFWLYRGLARVFGFLDEDYRLSKLVLRLDPDLRAGVKGPYDTVWKLSVNADDRQTDMWPRIEHDDYLRAHARMVWTSLVFPGPPIADDIITMTLAATRTAVATIRARGGEVVFVRPPSAPELRAIEEPRLPRAKGWDALLASAEVRGIHFDDDAAMQGLNLPEYSHLTRRCATVFTDAYVRRIVQLTPRLNLRADAPTPLTPHVCAPQTIVLSAQAAP